MAESPLSLNIEYFNNPDKSGALGLGLVYVGKPDLDPEVEANRVTVTIVQEDGTRVPIAPNQQPLTLNAGGNVDYLGSPVTVLVNGIYSVKVLDLGLNQKFYVPFSNEFPELVTPFDNVAEMITIPGDFDGQQAYLGGYYDIGDGGNGPMYWYATSTETADNGMIFGAFAVGRWKRPDDEVSFDGFGAVGDGDGAGGGTENSTAIQAAFTHFLANGGGIGFGSGKTYRCDSAVTLVRTAGTDAKRFTIYGNNAQLDFSNTTGSAIGLLVGASSNSFWSDSGQIGIKDLKILGPETLAPNITTNTPTTTTIGLSLQFALNVTLDNVYISRFHTGLKTESVFPLTSNYVHCASNFVGAHLFNTSNDHLWNNLSTTNARFGIVCEASATNGSDMIALISPRVETCYIGMVVDAGASASNNIHGVNIHNPFMNSNTSALLVLNKEYDFSDPTGFASWADRDGKINNLMWMGGRLSTSASPVISGETTYGSIRGAYIQTATIRSRITGLYPNGTLACQYTSAVASDLDIYYYDSTGAKYVNISDGAIRTNKASGSETFVISDDQTAMTATIENKDSAGSLRFNVQNDASGALQLWSYGSTHATKANMTEINSVNADFDLQRAGASKILIQSTTGATGGAASGGAGNQYVELNIGGVRYKLLHDGTL